MTGPLPRSSPAAAQDAAAQDIAAQDIPAPARDDAAAAAAAESFLLGRIDYERTPPAGNVHGAFRLERMQDFLARLGDPQTKLPCVHIAGSKGKGSTAAMTAAILTQAGRRTGLFTSPHVERFEERIQIDGVLIPTERFQALVEQIRPIVADMDRAPLGGPTFFELTTALAWLHFLAERVDLVVLEVGLGGRLDATNICRPLVSIITSISRDHTRILGDRPEQIAREKAGIIKPGVPVLTAVAEPGPLAVIRELADRHGAPCHVLGDGIRLTSRLATTTAVAGDAAGDEACNRRDRDGHETNRQFESSRQEIAAGGLPFFDLEIVTPWRTHRGLRTPLAGEHQCRNAALAVAAVDALHAQGAAEVAAEAIPAGLRAVRWPLRVEVVARRPWLILDAAHNEASIQALVDALRPVAARRRLAVFGSSRDKDAPTMLRLLAAGFDQLIVTQFLGNPRAIPADELRQLAEQAAPGRVTLAPTPAAALQAARSLASVDDLICVTGSFFLAGEILELLRSGAN